VRFDFLTAVNTVIVIFVNVTLFSMIDRYQHFGGTCWFHPQKTIIFKMQHAMGWTAGTFLYFTVSAVALGSTQPSGQWVPA
jgi:hypothetical protein